jgi:hypothetical protein
MASILLGSLASALAPVLMKKIGITSGVRAKHHRRGRRATAGASQKQLAALAKGRATAARNRRARKGR